MTIANQTLEARIAHHKRLAEEARSKADETTDATYRAILLEAAESWDRLAELEQKSAAASATLTQAQSKKLSDP
jgi:hypothetical protein